MSVRLRKISMVTVSCLRWAASLFRLVSRWSISVADDTVVVALSSVVSRLGRFSYTNSRTSGGVMVTTRRVFVTSIASWVS